MADPNLVEDKFAAAKRRITQQANAQSQTNQDTIDRSAAQAGAVGSGAFEKQKLLAENDVNKNAQNAMTDVDTAQAEDLRQKQEVENQRKFQTSEREASQAFGSGEAAKQRDFMTGERQASQKYGTSERLASQGFSKELYDSDMNFKQDQMWSANNQFDRNMSMAKKQFNLDEEVSRFNMAMAEKMSNKKGMMDGLGQILSAGTYSGAVQKGSNKIFGTGGGDRFSL